MPIYVRVRDPQSRQEWDEPEGSVLIRDGRVQVIKSDRYPPSRVIRPTKRFLSLRARGRKKPEPAGEGTTTTEKE